MSSNGRTRDFGSLYHGSNPCAPTTLRVCDASGGKPERNSSREGVPHEVLTKCGRRNYYLFTRHWAGFLFTCRSLRVCDDAILDEIKSLFYHATMFYVYLITSISVPGQKYIGMTDDLPNRLKQHNAGYSFHTAKYKPWKLVNYFAFSSRHAAAEFEQYLKPGSGQAFANKHFWK